MTSTEVLTSLNIKRGTIKRKLTLAQNALQDLTCFLEIQERLTKLRPIYDEFFDLQMQIEETEALLKQPSSADQGITFDKEYHYVISELRTLEAKHNPVITRTLNYVEDTIKSVPVKLPELTLPSFDGSYTEWTSFYDTFSALVDQNKQLSEIHKFHYLKSCLKGKAIKTVESLKVTAENYQVAWAILQNRYDNQRLIVQDHIFGILNHSNINKPSHQELRKLLDSVCSNLEALMVHEINAEKFRDAILIAIMSEKLDFISKREWQAKLTSKLPTWNEMRDFLEKRCETLETLYLMSNKLSSTNNDSNTKKGNSRAITNLSTNKNKKSTTIKSLICPYCSQNHNLFYCSQFLNLMVKDRLNFVKSKNLCYNCFRDNHSSSNCKSEHRCKICKEPHNSLLHQNQSQSSELPGTSSQQQSTVLKLNSRQVYFSSVILPTAQVQVYDHLGKNHVFRCLLDSGSELNFVSERVAKILKLKIHPIVLSIAGLNHSTTNASKMTDVKIHSNYQNYNLDLSCVVIPQISEFLPSNTFSTTNLEFPNYIQLADPTFHMKGEIDLLIGAQVFFQLLEPNRESLSENFLLQETKLGWVVVNSYCNRPDVSTQSSCHCARPILEEMVNKFWELDSFENQTIVTPDDVLCEKIFNEGYKRSETGKYSVPLPFKQEIPNLGTSRGGAIKRFKSLEHKFRKDQNFKNAYTDVIKDYLRQGHAEQVPANEPDNSCYFLPHHGVIKQSSTTTQLRVVFDASAKTSNGKSLNDLLLVGPKLQSDLYHILLRFREYKVAFTADISQMYRQVQVHPQYYDYQRFVWRFDENEQIQTYRLKTLTFGVTSAPYLAIRTLHQLAMDEKCYFPNAYNHITNNMYVDDLLSGSDTPENALKLKSEISECLSRGTFLLRKWASNDKSLLPNSFVNTSEINLDKEGISKTLGVIWNCNSDQIQYRIKLKNVDLIKSKRGVLSVTAQLFDPLGLIAPVVVTAKIILQKLWTAKLEWDEKLPDHLQYQWDNFIKTLSDLNNIIFPRCIIGIQNPKQIELHGFCDSSQLAYGACIFIKSCNKNGDIHVQLLTAKSRVAPVKTQTLPRLELCGAVLLAELATQVKESLNCHINREFYYTDSTIVLSWLAASPNTWTTFVANRISKIQTLTKVENWTHVSSIANPADIISRGCSPKQLTDNKLWLNGPAFLWQNVTENSTDIKTFINSSETEERRQVVCTKAVINTAPKSELLLKYSSFTKLVDIIAFCLRFFNRCKLGQKVTGPLSVKELKNSHNVIMKLVQQESFPDEYNCLIKNKPLPKSSPLIKLNPFLDENSIIRVGGRLVNANILYDKKFPIVIPKKHHITKLIIECEHLRHLHAGPQATLAALRQRYWPLGGREIIRNILHNCVPCRRVKPITYEEIMGNLPNARINLVRPFLNCGVDYAGPILVREGKGRGKKSIKAYICLFICLATKAIHLELVTDCTSLSFVGAFKRFMSRRGKPSNIYSDNATTFKGSDRELQFIHKEIVKSESFKKFIQIENNVNWHFIPPRSPNVGGIWEAGIKSMKFHFKRVIGQSLFTYEEMYTYLTLIEACLNSRPITPLSSNPDDLNALTPGHFLIGTALTAPAEPDVSAINIHRLDQWQKIQQMKQHFWKRWSREYIVELQQRSKWATSHRPAAEGEIVLINEDNIPPLCWCLGRIESVHPGRDGKVRTVSVRTKNGIVQRSVRKLSPLPV